MDKPRNDESPGQPTIKSSFRWVGWMLSVLVFYVLSAGPITKLFLPRIIPEQFRVIYAPLWWLADHSTLFSEFYEWYMHLWGNF
jgi:hypothetical protein